MTRLYLYVRRYLAVLFLFGALAGFAQGRTVTGKVTSADDGSGIPGVNILEKGTSNGTVSDVDGNYSITVGDNATLVFSFVGYITQEVPVGTQSAINASLQSDVTSLSEVVVVGYGSQDKKEITGSVVSLTTEQFNRGNVNDPRQLLQGKVPGLSIYNRGGNPNSAATFRLRGISTIGSNSQPLIVIDGVLGASLDNVDPNDIESVSVLKDGSAAAIYGSRGSAGVILVTTKRGSNKTGATTVDYNGYVAADRVFRRQPNLTAEEFIAEGGTDNGARTDWQDEVTRTGISNVHNVAISSGTAKTGFRASVNYRDINGVLRRSGFDQVNIRANINHTMLNDKLKVDIGFSTTDRRSDFSFSEALRYAVLFNPTAPIRASNGEFFQAVLFDNFNPLAIIEQNINDGKRKNINYNARIDYSLLKNLTATVNFGRQFENNFNGTYFSRSSLFVGFGRKGLARRFTSESDFTLFESWLTYQKEFGKFNLDLSGGYSFQQDNYEELFIEAGGFQNDDLGYNQLEQAAEFALGQATVTSAQNPDNKVIAFFGRANLTFDKGIYFNASVRREGSTKLGANNRWGIFPAFGLGVDITKYLPIPKVDQLKLRAGFGVTGSLPAQSGLAQDLYVYNAANNALRLARNANEDLKWEQKRETNVGLDFGVFGRLTGSIDYFVRDIQDFILERDVDVTQFVSGRRFENVGSLRTSGLELALNYSNINLGQVRWTPGLVIGTNQSELTSFFNNRFVTGNFGSPGQNGTPINLVEVGQKLGTIWGPVYDRPASDGKVVFKDLNGDGVIKADASQALLEDADFEKLGRGIPVMELGWTNQLSFKNWDLNMFFRGAFGHSLINQFRGFYEPREPGAINAFNRINTNLVVTDLREAKYSSLYVEKADFVKLDNVTLGYRV
ncbi:MAG: SusC/RagA family TonB-linked outer membrane protein, partial [Cyclobacteriaceae bacterium]|nr:SusC/RagA family TonB-linked outer membrane protein [Cyclobacteriaceae bacterium]